MTSAVAMLDDGFRPPSPEQVRPVDESLAPTFRTPEAAPAHEPAMRAAVKGWPTLPGYEILAELGRGGMAFVYKARDLRRQRFVAIKVSDPSQAGDDEVIARFGFKSPAQATNALARPSACSLAICAPSSPNMKPATPPSAPSWIRSGCFWPNSRRARNKNPNEHGALFFVARRARSVERADFLHVSYAPHSSLCRLHEPLTRRTSHGKA